MLDSRKTLKSSGKIEARRVTGNTGGISAIDMMPSLAMCSDIFEHDRFTAGSGIGRIHQLADELSRKYLSNSTESPRYRHQLAQVGEWYRLLLIPIERTFLHYS